MRHSMKYLILISGLLFMGSMGSLDSKKATDNTACIKDPETICNQLVGNCRATAVQEYNNGNYSEAVYHMFYDSICPNAGLECIFDVM